MNFLLKEASYYDIAFLVICRKVKKRNGRYIHINSQS